MGAFLTYLKGLAPKNRFGLAFGSYGWGGQSIPQIHELLNECGFAMMEPQKCRYIPDAQTLGQIRESVAASIVELEKTLEPYDRPGARVPT